MSSVKQFTQRLKFVKLSDIMAIPVMILGYLISIPFRIVHRNIWLICERENEARDNGFWLFKYLCENHNEIETVYAINKNGIDYKKVSEIGHTIQFGSLTHWVYYFTAKRNVSSQKEGKPNAALCFLLEVYLGARKNRAYIRHGICKDDQRWVYYDVTKMNLFVCAAKREFDFVSKRFGYPEENVKLIGLCRFDNLLSPHSVKRQIIVMPTMREWLRTVSTDTILYEGHDDISKSEYVKVWNSFLSNSKLDEMLIMNQVELLFFPHASMQKYVDMFSTSSNWIKIASLNEYDVQTLLMESAMLVTDYSSIYFDFAYMKKPLIYYQFDYEKYRRGQYQEGYYSYLDDGFGVVTNSEDELIDQMTAIIKNDFQMESTYKERVENFFAFHDTNNCQRTYEAIRDM